MSASTPPLNKKMQAPRASLRDFWALKPRGPCGAEDLFGSQGFSGASRALRASRAPRAMQSRGALRPLGFSVVKGPEPEGRAGVIMMGSGSQRDPHSGLRARTHARTPAHARTHAHVRTHARTRARMHARARAGPRAHARTHARTHAPARPHARARARTHAQRRAHAGLSARRPECGSRWDSRPCRHRGPLKPRVPFGPKSLLSTSGLSTPRASSCP